MATYLIGGVILLYVIYVAVRKIKDWKQGKYCGCGCNRCSSVQGCSACSAQQQREHT